MKMADAKGKEKGEEEGERKERERGTSACIVRDLGCAAAAKTKVSPPPPPLCRLLFRHVVHCRSLQGIAFRWSVAGEILVPTQLTAEIAPVTSLAHPPTFSVADLLPSAPFVPFDPRPATFSLPPSSTVRIFSTIQFRGNGKRGLGERPKRSSRASDSRLASDLSPDGTARWEMLEASEGFRN